jgi:hypothetical protein
VIRRKSNPASTAAMKTTYKIPHVESVEVPRDHVIRLTFDDGITRELEFLAGSNQGTVFRSP